MDERKDINLCMILFTIVLVGVLVMANTIFVVWPPEVLAQHGYVQPLTYGELINAEGLTLSSTQISALERGPQFQGSVPGIADLISRVRGEREPAPGEKWGREDPSETSVRVTSSEELGMPVENIPKKEPSPTQQVPTTRRVPRRRPIPR